MYTHINNHTHKHTHVSARTKKSENIIFLVSPSIIASQKKIIGSEHVRNP